MMDYEGDRGQQGVDAPVEIKTAQDVPDKQTLIVGVLRVEEEAWPEEIRATQEKFETRLQIFPEGFFLAYHDGKLAGVLTSEIIDYEPGKPPESWEKITDNGFIQKTHNPRGNALYVVSLGVSDWAQGKGVGSELLKAAKELAREKGLQNLVLGARLPGYRDFHKEHSDIDAEQYAAMKREGSSEPLDPEVRFYSRNGLKVVRVIPTYMEDDPESENYGVVMVWENPQSK